MENFLRKFNGKQLSVLMLLTAVAIVMITHAGECNQEITGNQVVVSTITDLRALHYDKVGRTACCCSSLSKIMTY